MVVHTGRLTTVRIGKHNLTTKAIDGTCFVIENRKSSKGIIIYSGYILNSVTKKIINRKNCYVAEKDNFYAHGETPKKAVGDLQFKIVAEKLKKDPIKKDTLLTVKYYRLITGACDLGVREWMKNNNIPFKVENDQTIEVDPIKAVDLLPLLRKSNAYGIQKFESLLSF